MICNCQGGFFASAVPLGWKHLSRISLVRDDRAADVSWLPLVAGGADLALGVNLDLRNLIELRRFVADPDDGFPRAYDWLGPVQNRDIAPEVNPVAVGPVPVRHAVRGEQDGVFELAHGRFVERILRSQRALSSLRERARTRRREAGIDGNGRTLAQFLPDYRPAFAADSFARSELRTTGFPSFRDTAIRLACARSEHRLSTTHAERRSASGRLRTESVRRTLTAPGSDHSFQPKDMHVTGQSVGKIHTTALRVKVERGGEDIPFGGLKGRFSK